MHHLSRISIDIYIKDIDLATQHFYKSNNAYTKPIPWVKAVDLEHLLIIGECIQIRFSELIFAFLRHEVQSHANILMAIVMQINKHPTEWIKKLDATVTRRNLKSTALSE